MDVILSKSTNKNKKFDVIINGKKSVLGMLNIATIL